MGWSSNPLTFEHDTGINVPALDKGNFQAAVWVQIGSITPGSAVPEGEYIGRFHCDVTVQRRVNHFRTGAAAYGAPDGLADGSHRLILKVSVYFETAATTSLYSMTITQWRYRIWRIT